MHSYSIPILKGIYSLERVLSWLGYFFRITQSYPTGPKLNKYSTYKTYLHLLKRLPQQRTNWTIQLKGSSNSIQVVSSELLLTAWKHIEYKTEADRDRSIQYLRGSFSDSLKGPSSTQRWLEITYVLFEFPYICHGVLLGIFQVQLTKTIL